MVDFFSYFKEEDLKIEEAKFFIDKIFKSEIYNDPKTSYHIIKIGYILLKHFDKIDTITREKVIIKIKEYIEFLEVKDRLNFYSLNINDNYTYSGYFINKLSRVLIRIIIKNNNKLTKSIKDILIAYSDTYNDILRNLLHLLFLNYNILGAELKSLIYKNINEKSNSFFLAEAIEFYYDKLPHYRDYEISQDFIDDLLLRINISDRNEEVIIRLLRKYFDKLPKDRAFYFISEFSNKDLVITQSSSKKYSNQFIMLVKRYFKSMPQNMINSVIPVQAKYKKNHLHILELMKKYPENFSLTFDNILLKISEDTEQGKYVVKLFDMVDSDLREKIIYNLLKNRKNYNSVIYSIIKYYDFLPSELRKLIFDIPRNNESIVINLGCSILKYRNKLPENVLNLLIELPNISEKLKEIITLNNYDLLN